MNRHHHLFHFLHNRELNELYISIAIRTFALSMVNVFVPIYLLKLGYSLASVLIFYAILNAVHALFVIPASMICSKYGFKHSIFFSIPFLLVFYMLLYSLEQYSWSLYFPAIVFGFSNALFWMGYHVDFSKFSDRKNRGEELGVARIISQLFHIIGPAVGGLILTFIGFKALFACVSVLLMASVIPLFFSKDIHEPMNFSLTEIFNGLNLKDRLAFIGYGIESGMGTVIWPIFIFFSILNNYTSLGFVSSLSLFFSLIFIFVISRFSDSYRRLALRIGAVANAVIWTMRSFVKTGFYVFVIDSFYGIAQTTINIPFDALCYDKANKSNIVKFIINREIAIQTGRVFLFLALLSVTDLVAGFVLGGVGASVLYLLF
ncbi:MAG: MFS transporter [Candidatus Aenigmarchaeota archaeon]|nr:MFS transporter [Candidatus Aenigmarchaeota archaeon]